MRKISKKQLADTARKYAKYTSKLTAKGDLVIKASTGKPKVKRGGLANYSIYERRN